MDCIKQITNVHTHAYTHIMSLCVCVCGVLLIICYAYMSLLCKKNHNPSSRKNKDVLHIQVWSTHPLAVKYPHTYTLHGIVCGGCVFAWYGTREKEEK